MSAAAVDFDALDAGFAGSLGRVAVLCGGASAEREVSLRSGAAVFASLQRSGVDCVKIDLGRDICTRLATESPDIVFIALHGRGGEDGSVQGLLEVLGIPYTGSKVMASAVAMDKWLTKQLWCQAGLPTPGGMRLEKDSDPAGVVEQLGLPIFVKPAREGSSIGMSRVDQAEQLADAWRQAAAFDSNVLAERFVDGAEFTVAILDGRALPVLRVETDRAFYDFEAKYTSDDTRYLYPSGLSAAAEHEISQLALQAFAATGCEGWGRVDVMQDSAGGFWLLEVNTVPGLTDHSLVPMAASHAGLDFDALILRILAAVRSDAGGVAA